MARSLRERNQREERNGSHMENLFTLVVEYGGGTYLSQVSADTPREALLKWSMDHESAEGEELPLGVFSGIRAQLQRGDDAVAISGSRNVWCISGVSEDKLILIHVILTP